MTNRSFYCLTLSAAMALAGLAWFGMATVDRDVPDDRAVAIHGTVPGAHPMGHSHFIENPDGPMPPGAPLEFYVKNFKPLPPERQNTFAACFAEGTPMEVVNFVEEAIYGGGQRYVLNTRWSGAQGSPRALTWSFAPDGLSIPGGNVPGEVTSPNNLFATLDAAYAAQGGRATWILRFQQCFDRWAELCGTSYTRITVGGNDWDDGAAWGSTGSAGLRGDVRIAMHPLDGASNVLAYNFFPSNGDMVLDSDDSASYDNSGNSNRFLRNVVSHEHGHGIGLSHVCPYTDQANRKLMEPFINTAYDTQRHDDIRASQRHYGDDFEDNNNAGQAFSIGTVETGSPIHYGDVPLPVTGTNQSYSALLSNDASGEEDWWRFQANGARVATATITPFGTSYASYSQDANCNNNSQNIINSLAMSNLNVSIVDTNGVTILGDSAVQPAGVAEVLSSVCLPSAGDYFVKVYESSFTLQQSQSYKIDLSVACPTVSVDPIANASTTCGSAYASGTPSATTSCGGVTWSLGGSPPAGMTIDPGTGVVSWPNPVTSPTPYTITVQAGNGCNSSSQNYNLSVLVGDFNGDGVLDDLDIPQFADHLLGLDTSRICAADVNGDSSVDGLDALAWVDLAQ